MKINFRKISAIAASALMTGMTMGVAAAANYPAPFVTGGSPNVAIVYGTGAGVSQLDFVQAGNIQESLGEYVTGGSVTVEGGESFVLEKTSNNFNLGDALNGAYSELDDEDLEFLADGTYDDGDIDTDYTQTVTPGTKTLTLFADSDYNNKAPTLGFKWANGDNVLDYDIEFDDTIPFEDLEDTDLPLMGNTYYVLSASSTQIVLLDSAERVILTEGDSVTVGDKTVEIEYIEDGYVKFNVDGEITDKLADHGYEELSDGSYIVANEILYAAKEAGISKVEFSIGAGKMTLKDTEEIELNDEDVDGLAVDWTTNGTTGFLDAMNIAWNADGELFLTEENAITMPLFEKISLAYGGLAFPESEEIALESGEQMTLTMGNYELPLFHIAGTAGDASTLGEEDYTLVTATASVANYTGNTTAWVLANTGGLDLVEDNRFIVTVNDTDLGDVETLYYEVSSIDGDDPDNIVIELNDLIGSKDVTLNELADTTDVGEVTITLNQVNDTNIYLKFSGATLNYNVAYSDKGMRVVLPAKNSAETVDLSSSAGEVLTLQEANNDGDLGSGDNITATVKANTNEKLHVSATGVTTLEDADDVYVGYVVSDLASKVTLDETADEYEFTVDYYGEEVSAEVKVVAGASTITPGESELGNVIVKDSEVSSVATKNLIVVGGSCINSAAAQLVGGTKCGAAWTTATGIGSGQFLIKGYADSTITTGLALLVAGYDAEDTVKATTYLLNKDVDTSKAYKGTTTTETAVVID